MPEEAASLRWKVKELVW